MKNRIKTLHLYRCFTVEWLKSNLPSASARLSCWYWQALARALYRAGDRARDFTNVATLAVLLAAPTFAESNASSGNLGTQSLASQTTANLSLSETLPLLETGQEVVSLALSFGGDDSAAGSKPYTKAQALHDVQTVINQFTITEFCGHDSWSVRKGYEMSRRQFLDFKIVSRAEFRDLRLEAIKSAESYLDEAGPDEFTNWCRTQSVTASQFFMGLMSGDIRKLEARLQN